MKISEEIVPLAELQTYLYARKMVSRAGHGSIQWAEGGGLYAKVYTCLGNNDDCLVVIHDDEGQLHKVEALR